MTVPGDRQDALAGVLTVPEAAARLGVTPDAVRRRLHRGTLTGDKTDDGHWRVWLPEPLPEHPPGQEPGDRQDSATMPPGRAPADTELIETLRSEVTYLRSALDAEVEARRRADHLVAGLMERLPELAATTETPQERVPAPVRDDRPAKGAGGLIARVRRLVGR